MDFRAKRNVKDGDVYGVERVSRHANLWSLASLGVGTALLTPFVVESFFSQARSHWLQSAHGIRTADFDEAWVVR